MNRIKVLSLAALVAFAACDEGAPPIVAPPVTGTITGVVTIEGAARTGVSVALSTGQTATTDASGAYSFAGVAAGTHTVTISGFPADATFTTTVRGATITTAGQVATVNFDGAWVRTSAIMGSVSAGGRGLAGVRVAITGAVTTGLNVNTDANGQYSFAGLRAGTYTVTISGFDAGQFTFTTVSSTVGLAVGQTQVAHFTGVLLATASISGTVTIEGAPAAGVRATLSTGAVATTSATGAYSFGSLTAGTYTVTISLFPADAQFATVAQTVVIASAGSTVTANFAGTFVRTATLNGLVTVAGAGVGGVTVTLSGAGAATVNTDANGLYSFSALRAGAYTVTISGWNAGLFTFATTSGTATLATGASASLNFVGAHVATAAISGSLFIDEMAPNGTFDTTTEDRLAVAGITIQAEGGAVGATITTTTTATGTYSFTGLTAGTYRISILGVTGAPLNPALPGNVAFRAAQATSEIRTVAVGGTATVNWPFNISHQAVRASAFRGTTAAPTAAPLAGTVLWLYDTYENAVGGVAAGRIATATTDAAGAVTFRFPRTLDVGPGATARDNIVFARLGTITALHTLVAPVPANPVIEIQYSPKDSTVTAPTHFRALANQIIVRAHAGEIDFDTLAAWQVTMRASLDSAGAVTYTGVTNASGDLTLTLTPAGLLPTSNGALPDTLWFRLNDPPQPATKTWVQTPSAGAATAAGRWLRYIWTGVEDPTAVVHLGAHRVRYTQTDVQVRVHREQDDSTGVTPTYTGGDNVQDVGWIQVELYRINADGTRTSVSGPFLADPLINGLVTFPNANPAFAHEVRARSTNPNLTVLRDTLVTIPLDGSDELHVDRTLQGSTAAFHSSFAIKANNNSITGLLRTRDGSPVGAGVSVRIQAGPGNIQSTTDVTIVTAAAGTYATAANLLEGPYTVTVLPTASVGFFQTLTTTNIIINPGGRSPTDVTMNSGTADNTSPTVAVRDVVFGAPQTANFLGRRLDTTIRGVVINDRDLDYHTIDSDEALSGVTVELWQDVDSSSVLAPVPIPSAADVLVHTVTTDGNGAYAFTGLAEGYYIVRPISPGNATVLRALDATGALTQTVQVTTRGVVGAAATLNQNRTRNVGNVNPPAQNDELPRWSYLAGTASSDGGNLGGGLGPNFTNGALTIAPTHFVHLFRTGTARGRVVSNLVGNPPVAGLRVTITRCQTTALAPQPPAVGACTAKHGLPSPHIMNIDTDASGNFTFSGLLEGVYQVDIAPATAGFSTIVTPGAPGSYLLTIRGNNDIATTPNFVVG